MLLISTKRRRRMSLKTHFKHIYIPRTWKLSTFVELTFNIKFSIASSFSFVHILFQQVFLSAYTTFYYATDSLLSTQPEGDFVWRIVLKFGAVPAALTNYGRLKMPETARYTALVEDATRRPLKTWPKFYKRIYH